MRQAGATLHRGARASHCRGLSCCGAQAPDAQAQQLWLTDLVAPQHVGSSRTRARTRVPCIGRQILNHCATREALTELLYFKRGDLCTFSHWDMEAMLDSLAFINKARWTQPGFPLVSWAQNSEHQLVIVRPQHGTGQVLLELLSFSLSFFCSAPSPFRYSSVSASRNLLHSPF